MASLVTQQQVYEALLNQYGQEIADAFHQAINDLARHVELDKVIQAVEDGDFNRLLDALHLDPAVYAPILDKVDDAFYAGGRTSTAALPTFNPENGLFVVRFDGRNIRAERWLDQYSSNFIQSVIEDQREAIRAALIDGMTRGDNPRTTGLLIVGQINRASGSREGGILGLSSQQTQFLLNARHELTGGNTSDLKKYLTRSLRDRRFDRAVERAIDKKTGLDKETIEKALRSYSNRLLQLRGETIGRTESLTALHAGQNEGLQQAVDSGNIRAEQIRRIWSTAGDDRVRHTHEELDGQSAGLGEPFRSPSGATLMYPGDPTAPAGEIINCRCNLNVRVDWLANIGLEENIRPKSLDSLPSVPSFTP